MRVALALIVLLFVAIASTAFVVFRLDDASGVVPVILLGLIVVVLFLIITKKKGKANA